MPPGSAGSTRARPTALLALAAALLVARVVGGVYEARHAPPLGGLVKWRAPDGTEVAAEGDKPILYDFSATWCEPCKRMDREVFANEESAALINASFVAVHVDDDDQAMPAAALRSRHHVEALPTLVVVRPGGGDPRRLQGYPGKQRVLSFLKHATEPEPSKTSPLPDFH
jgi:thiol:disulfide interchange protein